MAAAVLREPAHPSWQHEGRVILAGPWHIVGPFAGRHRTAGATFARLVGVHHDDVPDGGRRLQWDSFVRAGQRARKEWNGLWTRIQCTRARFLSHTSSPSAPPSLNPWMRLETSL